MGSFIGADLIKNEITAQTRAAAELDPEADIIEIGGQDSKLVIKRHGVVVDYQMNKACAAGTGSFIDELAEQLGVSVKNGEFARLAFDAPHTIDLGTRCAAFMGQAVASAQQGGVPLEVITASLANSIAKNYLSKVVETRKLGDKVILTGAVFYNEAVVSAFQRAVAGQDHHRRRSTRRSPAPSARPCWPRKRSNGDGSTFKGFQKVIDSNHKLTTFRLQELRQQLHHHPPGHPGREAHLLRQPVRSLRQQHRHQGQEWRRPSTNGRRLLFEDHAERDGKADRRHSQGAAGI